MSDHEPGFESDDEVYACVPCREMVPGNHGEIVVPGGTAGPVWCPWCGDKMLRADADHNWQAAVLDRLNQAVRILDDRAQGDLAVDVAGCYQRVGAAIMEDENAE